MMKLALTTLVSFLVLGATAFVAEDKEKLDLDWRSLPLIKDGRVDPAWSQIGGGRFVVDTGTLRTESDETGMGMLLYKRRKFGNCEIRVVFRGKVASSNSGVFIRIDNGIVKIAEDKDAKLKLSQTKGEDASE